MIEVRGSKSEDRWSQTEHEIFQPLPVKMLTVSPSGFGKTSVILAAADAIFRTHGLLGHFLKESHARPCLARTDRTNTPFV